MEKERKTSVCSVSDSLDAIAWGICEENCKMLVWVILTVYLYETCMKRGGKGGKKKKKKKHKSLEIPAVVWSGLHVNTVKWSTCQKPHLPQS